MTNRVLLVVLMLACVVPVMGQRKENECIGEAATVMKEILGMPDSIPKDLLDRAECVVIYPSVKKRALSGAATVMKEILGMPDSIPKDLLDRAECVVIYPSVKKAAFVVGGSYGRGLI